MLTSRQYRLNRSRTLALLSDVATNDVNPVLLPVGATRPDITRLLENAGVPPEAFDEVFNEATGSPTGAAVLWGEARHLLIRPPFPLTGTAGISDAEPLRQLLGSPFTVALVLVRLGAYAIGICRDERLITSKTGTGLVHGRHHKGGSSQGRFQRRRQNQTYHFLERVCGHVREQLEACPSQPDYVIYGGARTTILSLQKQCPLLGRFEERTLPPLLDIPRPRRAVLEEAVTAVWSSRITEWEED